MFLEEKFFVLGLVSQTLVAISERTLTKLSFPVKI